MAALISYSVVESVGSPRFICLDINFLNRFDQRITDLSFQTNNTYQISSIENEGFISYMRFFLSLTLLYNIKFSQILTHILMKKPGIRIFTIVSFWNINKP